MRRDERGQVVVEYILMVALVLSVVALISVGFRKSILAMWQTFSRDISAACPKDCPPKDNIRFR